MTRSDNLGDETTDATTTTTTSSTTTTTTQAAAKSPSRTRTPAGIQSDDEVIMDVTTTYLLA